MISKLPPYPEYIKTNNYLIGGIDEVGRGCFAGPVVSACVILPKGFTSQSINDSKKLTDKKRREAYDIIIDNCIAYSVQAVGVKMINKVGIEDATKLSMQKCIDDINKQTKLEYLLIDGNRWDDYKNIPFETVIKGDLTYGCIAAASIIAKVRRDDYMIKLSKKYPGYDWESNKGYHSKKHKIGLKEQGPTDYHRTQFIRNHI